MEIIENIDDLSLWKQKNKALKLALVPTMGSLHEGHLSLIRKAKQFADKVLVTIFVNPKQFNNQQDFLLYPRSLEEDIFLLSGLGCDAVFLPQEAEIFSFSCDELKSFPWQKNFLQAFCAPFRPGHFEGVLEIVYRFFKIIKPNFAVFGVKDYQQCFLIRAMVNYFNLDVELNFAASVREKNGLVMSSRNRRLSFVACKKAEKIYSLLLNAKKDLQKAGNIKLVLEKTIFKFKEFSDLEYLELRKTSNLEEVENSFQGEVVLAVALNIEKVRLIDSVIFEMNV